MCFSELVSRLIIITWYWGLDSFKLQMWFKYEAVLRSLNVAGRDKVVKLNTGGLVFRWLLLCCVSCTVHQLFSNFTQNPNQISVIIWSKAVLKALRDHVPAWDLLSVSIPSFSRASENSKAPDLHEQPEASCGRQRNRVSASVIFRSPT